MGRRSKRRKLPLLSENWGEDLVEDGSGEQEIPDIVKDDCTTAPTCPPSTGRKGRGVKRSTLPSTTLNSSLITDHFYKVPRMMSRADDDEGSWEALSPATLSYMMAESRATDPGLVDGDQSSPGLVVEHQLMGGVDPAPGGLIVSDQSHDRRVECDQPVVDRVVKDQSQGELSILPVVELRENDQPLVGLVVGDQSLDRMRECDQPVGGMVKEHQSRGRLDHTPFGEMVEDDQPDIGKVVKHQSQGRLVEEHQPYGVEDHPPEVLDELSPTTLSCLLDASTAADLRGGLVANDQSVGGYGVAEQMWVGGANDQSQKMGGRVRKQPRDTTSTAKRLFKPELGVVTSLRVGGDFGPSNKDDIWAMEDDHNKKEDDRNDGSPVLMVGDDDNLGMKTRTGLYDTPVPDIPGVSPGTCQDDRDDGGAEFSALSSETESSMLAASQAADALWATTNATGGYNSNCFVEDKRFGGRQHDEKTTHGGDGLLTTIHQSESPRGRMMKDDSLVSDRRRDTATPETSISRFFKRHTDKTSTPISTNKILLVSTDVADAANQSPTTRGHQQPTNHATNHHNNPSTTTTPTHTKRPPTKQPKGSVRKPKPTMIVVRDRSMTGCSYVGDVCNLHGPGAALKWKLAGKKTTKPGGRAPLGKEYYYECEQGVEKKRKLLQPKISSLSCKGKTQGDTGEDISLETHSVGQTRGDAQQDKRAGINQDSVRIDK